MMTEVWTTIAIVSLLSAVVGWSYVGWLLRRERRLQALASDAIAELAAVICYPGVSIEVWRETQAKVEALDVRSLDLGVYR